MKSEYKALRLWPVLAALFITGSLVTPALALDDGARAYWNGKDGTDGTGVVVVDDDDVVVGEVVVVVELVVEVVVVVVAAGSFDEVQEAMTRTVAKSR